MIDNNFVVVDITKVYDKEHLGLKGLKIMIKIWLIVV